MKKLFTKWLLAAALACSFWQVNAQVNLQNGLVLYYPFSGNAADSSGNGLNGSISGATLTTDRNNKPNAAFSFNGTSNITTPDNSLLDISTPGISLSAWVYPTQVSNGINSNTAYRIIDKYIGYTVSGYLLDILVSRTTSPQFRFAGATSSTVSNFIPTSTAIVQPNIWQHIAVVYDNDSLKFYVNGVLNNTVKGDIPLKTNTLPLLIGQDPSGGSGFVGSIDEVRIYGRTLNPQEVNALYTGTLPGNTSTSPGSGSSSTPGSSTFGFYSVNDVTMDLTFIDTLGNVTILGNTGIKPSASGVGNADSATGNDVSRRISHAGRKSLALAIR